jgi:hypothetical protein
MKNEVNDTKIQNLYINQSLCESFLSLPYYMSLYYLSFIIEYIMNNNTSYTLHFLVFFLQVQVCAVALVLPAIVLLSLLAFDGNKVEVYYYHERALRGRGVRECQLVGLLVG